MSFKRRDAGAWSTMRYLFAWIAVVLAGAPAAQAANAVVCFERNVPAVRFAAAEIQRAFAAKNVAVRETDLSCVAQAATSTRVVLVSSPGQRRRVAAALKIAELE